MSKRKKIIFSVVLVICVLLTSWVFGGSSTKPGASADQIYDQKFKEPISTLLYYIQNYYYDKDKVNYDKVVDSTLNGLVNGLNDPFCWYFDARQTKENEIDEKGEYGGLGITVRYDSAKKAIVVVSPMAGTPAESAGLLPEDLIITVEGSSVAETGYLESIDRMRGKPGTPVNIEIYREGWQEPKKISIVRALIETKTVKFDVVDYQNKKVAYIKLTNFGEKSDEEMKEALNSLKDQVTKSGKNYDGVVLDLRNNPGGYLNVAINICSMLMRNGKIVTVKYFDGSQNVVSPIPGKYYSFLNKLPIVVLVNKGSASASEITTGALKDNKIATIIGKTTYGKAAVQRPITISNGGEVWLPIGHYFTPNGSDIHLKGINPDIEIDNPPIEIKADVKINEKDKTDALFSTTNKIKLDTVNDIQLKKGLDILLEKMGR